jgi:uncharacterized protein (TIGR01777 family)
MKLLITGGTGFVGTRLLERLKSEGHQLVVLTRNPDKARLKGSFGATYHRWDGISEEVPAEAYAGVEGVINLMGENIAAKRWSDSQKKKLEDSRIKATKTLIEGIEKHVSTPLKVFISASAIGYYPVNTGNLMDENTNPGDGYLAGLCKGWEEATQGLTKVTRKINMRIGVIFGPESGALSKLLPIFKLGGGGPVGSGKMVMSWIHVEDLVKAISEFTTNEKYSGTYNMVAPNPVTNKEFSTALGKALSRPSFMPAPPFMLKLVFGEMSTMILKKLIVRT